MSSTSTGQPRDRGWYEIQVHGRLEQRWSDWFDGLALTTAPDGITTLRGLVVDQAALHGLLQRHLPKLPGPQPDLPTATVLCVLLTNLLLARRQYLTVPIPCTLNRSDWNRTRSGRAGSGNSRAIPSSEMFSARVRVVFIRPMVSSQETCKVPASTA